MFIPFMPDVIGAVTRMEIAAAAYFFSIIFFCANALMVRFL